ncbi:MAG: helix-turn-helix domain-containing protein [Microthrixaceae bacterium]
MGERLRLIRRQKRLSLQEVEAISDQEFKASVLGAYERGERAISVPRLQRLARFYKVPVDQLLPEDDEDEGAGSDQADSGAKIDLTRLEGLEGTEADMLNRYLRMIQVQRQDFNGYGSSPSGGTTCGRSPASSGWARSTPPSVSPRWALRLTSINPLPKGCG